MPVHPGKILKREIEARRMSANRLAVELSVPASRIDRIIKCKRSVTPETALRLAAYFGGSAQFWLNIQSQHDLAVAEASHGMKIKRLVRAAKIPAPA